MGRRTVKRNPNVKGVSRIANLAMTSPEMVKDIFDVVYRLLDEGYTVVIPNFGAFRTRSYERIIFRSVMAESGQAIRPACRKIVFRMDRQVARDWQEQE